jgi:hypothetical protein
LRFNYKKEKSKSESKSKSKSRIEKDNYLFNLADLNDVVDGDEKFDEEMLEFSKEVEMDLDEILSHRDPPEENSNPNNSNYKNSNSIMGNRVIKMKNLKDIYLDKKIGEPMSIGLNLGLGIGVKNKNNVSSLHLKSQNVPLLKIDPKIKIEFESKMATSKSCKSILFSAGNNLAKEIQTPRVIQLYEGKANLFKNVQAQTSSSNYTLNQINPNNPNNPNFINQANQTNRNTNLNLINSSYHTGYTPAPPMDSSLIKNFKLNEVALGSLATTRNSNEFNNYHREKESEKEREKFYYTEKKILKNKSYKSRYKIHNNVFNSNSTSRNSLTSSNFSALIGGSNIYSTGNAAKAIYNASNNTNLPQLKTITAGNIAINTINSTEENLPTSQLGVPLSHKVDKFKIDLKPIFSNNSSNHKESLGKSYVKDKDLNNNLLLNEYYLGKWASMRKLKKTWISLKLRRRRKKII